MMVLQMRRDKCHTKHANAANRIEREVLKRFCLADGSIDWPRIVTLVSKNA